MGKKSEARRALAVLGGGRGRVTKARVATFLTVGFAIGLGLGYIFMGTIHAVSGSDPAQLRTAHPPIAGTPSPLPPVGR